MRTLKLSKQRSIIGEYHHMELVAMRVAYENVSSI